MKTIFETAMIQVKMNSSDELFVSNKISGVTIRIRDYSDGILITSPNGSIFEPTNFNGLPGIIMRER